MDMFCSYMRTLWIMTIVYTLKHCKTEVTEVSYSTSYPADSGEDYIVDGEQFTLECVFTGALGTLSWWTERDGSQLIFSGSPGNANIPDTVYKSRIDEQNSVFTATSHQLVITVSKHQDNEQEFKCTVVPSGGIFGSDKRKPLGDILARPTSISLDGLGVVMEGIQQIIDCEMNSVYKGQDVTEFSVKVGDSKLTSGTKSQTTGSLSGTYNVKYTQRVTFTYSQHQGQEVQCEVIWMDETSVKTVITSAAFILDVYVKATAVTLHLSASSAVEGTSVTFTCGTSSHPSPRLRLYRQREGQVTSNIRTHNGLTLSWDYTVQSEDNNAEFYCRVDDNQNIQGWDFDVQSEKQKLTVWYVHDVQVRVEPAESVFEGTSLTLTCDASGGNPIVQHYSWSFEPRYEVSRELSSNTKRTLEFDTAQYTQAGLYRCQAENRAGVESDSKEIFVHYAVKDISSSIQKIVFVSINDSAALNCTVRAYPAILKNAVTVNHDGISFKEFSFTAIDNLVDGFLIELTFDCVEQNDYGSYYVSLNNGLTDDLMIELQLLRKGVPESPHSVKFESVTAISATMLWISGRNGGSVQTFTIFYRKAEESKILYKEGIGDKGNTEIIKSTVYGLEPSTEYSFHVQSKNVNGISVSQTEISTSTLAIPTFKETPILKIYEDIGFLQWENPEGIYDQIFLEKCEEKIKGCAVILNITTDTHGSFALTNNDLGYVYYIAIYQYTDLVLQQEFTVIDHRDLQMNTGKITISLLAGLVVMTVLAILLAIVIIITFCHFHRKGMLKGCLSSMPKTNTKSNEEPQVSSYENVGQKEEGGQYAMKSSEAPSMPAEYTELKHMTYENI